MRIQTRIVVMLGIVALAVPAVAQVSFPQSVASGDPLPDSVVLWTRAVPADPAGMPRSLDLEVASDAAFQDVVVSRNVDLNPAYDGVVKVRVGGLEPYHTYWYRFSFGAATSPVGRTRTAPDPALAQPLKIAVVYCQDYVGRWYNSYAELLAQHDDDIDLVIHLGDYVYETTGDPAFQDPSGERRMEFADLAGAIPLGDGNYAAASLANYRTLYRTYRSDEMLQRVHERWPMVVIWDDHEFSDDAWGATATYFDGRVDEYDEDRKHASEQAFYEWVPGEAGLGVDGTLAIDPATMLYPNVRIWRDYHYGSLLHLILTDSRSFRPDHLVPENAFPGALAATEPGLRQVYGDAVVDVLRDQLDPYFDMRILGAAFPILRQTATIAISQAMLAEDPTLGFQQALALAADALDGLVSVRYLNGVFQAAGWPAPITDQLAAALPRGISYVLMGKTSIWSATGARYVLLWDPFNLYAGYLWATQGSAVENLFGAEQLGWLAATLQGSDATWRLLANSVMSTALLVDFSNPAIAAMLPPGFPDELRTRLLLTADDWDGFPQNRWELEGLVPDDSNTVILSGDIHATFVSDHGDGLFELTGPAISSGTFGDLVGRAVHAHPILSQLPGIDQLLPLLPQLLQISTIGDPVGAPDITYARTSNHGYMVLDIAADAITATMMEIPEQEVFVDHYADGTLDGLFTPTIFRIEDNQLTQLP